MQKSLAEQMKSGLQRNVAKSKVRRFIHLAISNQGMTLISERAISKDVSVLFLFSDILMT